MALADHVRPADRWAVLGILHSLASTGRFTLNLSLMSHAERESCRALFQKLQAMGTPHSPEGQGLGEQLGGLQEEERSAARASADAIPPGLIGTIYLQRPQWSSEAFFDFWGDSAGLNQKPTPDSHLDLEFSQPKQELNFHFSPSPLGSFIF